jgi:hypothetical protein
MGSDIESCDDGQSMLTVDRALLNGHYASMLAPGDVPSVEPPLAGAEFVRGGFCYGLSTAGQRPPTTGSRSAYNGPPSYVVSYDLHGRH